MRCALDISFCDILLSWEFITVSNIHIIPIHEQYVKYSSVLLAFYDSSVIKHRKVSSVSLSKMKVNIVILIAAVNLFPDTCFDLLLLVFSNQIAEAFLCEPKELIHILISAHVKKLVVGVKEFVISFVCFVYDKRTREVFGDILKCESQLFPDS